ncbi:collagen alpha-1(II) chain, partial [Erinaceus europaeus]|uniref:Collagen alpha-1(II) chain n=1 Tax=Erinaceus europaeus TaxID=9365 RepID=A0ABM3WUT1_ERIEU
HGDYHRKLIGQTFEWVVAATGGVRSARGYLESPKPPAPAPPAGAGGRLTGTPSSSARPVGPSARSRERGPSDDDSGGRHRLTRARAERGGRPAPPATRSVRQTPPGKGRRGEAEEAGRGGGGGQRPGGTPPPPEGQPGEPPRPTQPPSPFPLSSHTNTTPHALACDPRARRTRANAGAAKHQPRRKPVAHGGRGGGEGAPATTGGGAPLAQQRNATVTAGEETRRGQRQRPTRGEELGPPAGRPAERPHNDGAEDRLPPTARTGPQAPQPPPNTTPSPQERGRERGRGQTETDEKKKRAGRRGDTAHARAEEQSALPTTPRNRPQPDPRQGGRRDRGRAPARAERQNTGRTREKKRWGRPGGESLRHGRATGKTTRGIPPPKTTEGGPAPTPGTPAGLRIKPQEPPPPPPSNPRGPGPHATGGRPRGHTHTHKKPPKRPVPFLFSVRFRPTPPGDPKLRGESRRRRQRAKGARESKERQALTAPQEDRPTKARRRTGTRPRGPRRRPRQRAHATEAETGPRTATQPHTQAHRRGRLAITARDGRHCTAPHRTPAPAQRDPPPTGGEARAAGNPGTPRRRHREAQKAGEHGSGRRGRTPDFHTPPTGGEERRGARRQNEKSGPIRRECPSLAWRSLGPARENTPSPHRSSERENERASERNESENPRAPCGAEDAHESLSKAHAAFHRHPSGQARETGGGRRRQDTRNADRPVGHAREGRRAGPSGRPERRERAAADKRGRLAARDHRTAGRPASHSASDQVPRDCWSTPRPVWEDGREHRADASGRSAAHPPPGRRADGQERPARAPAAGRAFAGTRRRTRGDERLSAPGPGPERAAAAAAGGRERAGPRHAHRPAGRRGLNGDPAIRDQPRLPRRCRIVPPGRDSDLEAFSHNPTDGSFAPLAPQPSTYTKCLNLRFLSY